MNKVELVGRIATEIKVLKFNDGKRMARFSLAVNSKNQEAEFFSVVAWEKLADIVEQHCKKGERIAVCGALKTNHYTSTSGEKWHAVEIVSHEIEFLESKGKSELDQDLKPVDLPESEIPF